MRGGGAADSRVEEEQRRADARGSLHVAHLRRSRVRRVRAPLRRRPRELLARDDGGRAAEQVVGDGARKRELRRVRGAWDAVEREEEDDSSRAPVAGADVVPEGLWEEGAPVDVPVEGAVAVSGADGGEVRDALGACESRGQPTRVARQRVEAQEEAPCAGGPIALGLRTRGEGQG